MSAEKKVYYGVDGSVLDARFTHTQDHLADQDLRKLKLDTLNPLSPEVRVCSPPLSILPAAPRVQTRNGSLTFFPPLPPPRHTRIHLSFSLLRTFIIFPDHRATTQTLLLPPHPAK